MNSLAARYVLFLSLVCLQGSRLNAADHTVSVFPNGYSPNFLEIAPGDNVFWINEDDYPHTVTSVDGSWTRGFLIDYGDEFGLTFPDIGTYNYFCEFDGFSGTIVVRNPGPVPPNDRCSFATAMAQGNLYSVHTGTATSTGDPNPSCSTPAGKGVWYTFTPDASGLISISTCGSDFDTVLAVYTGTCASLSPLACNDDDGPACSGFKASLAFSGTAGTTYRIWAGGYNAASGTLRIIATNSASPLRFNEFRPLGDGGFEMRLRGGAGSFQIQASSNLVHWEPITNVLNATGETSITDYNTNNLPRRFYRAQVIPN